MVFVATCGCAGSSLLMAILTKLGMDTGIGFQLPANQLNGNSSFGGQYEVKIHGKEGLYNSKNFPYIVKSSRVCQVLPERIERWNLKVDHVYALLRGPSFLASVKERSERNKPEGYWEERLKEPGFLEAWDTGARRIERNFLMLCLNLARLDIPHTMIAYPDYLVDLPLTYKKLELLMNKYSISYERFKEVCDELVNKDVLDAALNFSTDTFRRK
jgi:hypothetical protein